MESGVAKVEWSAVVMCVCVCVSVTDPSLLKDNIKLGHTHHNCTPFYFCVCGQVLCYHTHISQLHSILLLPLQNLTPLHSNTPLQNSTPRLHSIEYIVPPVSSILFENRKRKVFKILEQFFKCACEVKNILQ